MKALVFVVAVAVSLVQPMSGQTADPRREPLTALKEAIRLLEAKDYVVLLKNFTRPDDLKEMLATKKIEDAAAEFGQRKAGDVILALRAAATMTPTMNAEGTRVDYRFEKPIGGETRVALVKIGEYWFLR